MSSLAGVPTARWIRTSWRSAAARTSRRVAAATSASGEVADTRRIGPKPSASLPGIRLASPMATS